MVSRAEFEGRTAVVTGAGGGLGSAIVALLAGRGARVVGCDQSDAALASPQLASRHVFNLLDRASIEAGIAAVLDRDGVPDILINNAGWTRAETLAALNADKIEHELDLNLTGVMTFADPIVKAMATRGSGSVVFISSVNAIAHFGNPAYAAAKAGINAYAKSIAVELGRSGVRANVVCPDRSEPPPGTIASPRTLKAWASCSGSIRSDASSMPRKWRKRWLSLHRIAPRA